MSEYPVPNLPASSKELKPRVDKLRQAIAKGKLERRGELVTKLGELALGYLLEKKISIALHTVDELIELADVLIEEGQIEFRAQKVSSLFSLMGFLPAVRANVRDLDESAFFNRLKSCIDQLSADEYFAIRNEWALEVHRHAERIEENGGTVAAIAILDDSIKTIEKLFPDPPRQFTEWKPLLDSYRSRGLWKRKIGDRLSAIDDLLHYATIAQKADDILRHNMKMSQQRNKGERNEKNQIVVRIYAEDYADFLAAMDFFGHRYEAAVCLADYYAEGAEKQKSLEHYDKALRTVTQNDIPETGHTASIFSAPAEIPFRKGTLLYQFHDYEEALKEFDLSLQELKKLLETEKEEYFEMLEDRLADLARFRADTLRALERFDEAEKEIETVKELVAGAVQTANRAKVASERKREKMLAQNPLAALMEAPKSAPNPISKKPSEMTERDLLYLLGVKHNEAMADVQRGMLEMQRGRWKTALKYFLKARIVVDSTVIHELPEAKKNIFSIYLGIARSYLGIEQFEESEKWYRRAIKQSESLIDEGNLEFRESRCETEEGLANLFSVAREPEKSFAKFEQAFKDRSSLIEMMEDDLKGFDREQLRVQDNQRLMPIAKLLKSQVQTARSIEEQLCELGRMDEALAWGRREMDVFEQMRGMLSHPEYAAPDYLDTAVSLASLLILLKRGEEADSLMEIWTRKLVDEHDEALEDAKYRVDHGVMERLYHLLGDADFHTEKRLIKLAMKFRDKGEPSHSKLLLDISRSRIQGWMEAEENRHRLVRLFWEKMIRTVDSELETVNAEMANPSGRNRDDDEDDEYLKYERDFVNASENSETMLQVLSEISGKTLTAKDKENYDRQMRNAASGTSTTSSSLRNTGAPVGRNDPCPCGSGKKYKKCCLKT
ncbi:MAG: SEC-C metal-binding domain-containing protein [Planctomycetaceae bacterium]|nr:SEC-C metal-binding domain-containing protein [Planctomycetaceae bacterium]